MYTEYLQILSYEGFDGPISMLVDSNKTALYGIKGQDFLHCTLFAVLEPKEKVVTSKPFR